MNGNAPLCGQTAEPLSAYDQIIHSEEYEAEYGKGELTDKV